MMIGLSVGIYSALKPRSLIDRSAMIFVLIGVSAHPVWIGLILEYVFGVKLGWTPIANYANFFGAPSDSGLPGGPWQWFYHLILPWCTFALLFAALYVRMIRANVIETLNEDFVRTARAKGAPEGQVISVARAAERAAAGRDDARDGHRHRARRGDLHGDRLTSSRGSARPRSSASTTRTSRSSRG